VSHTCTTGARDIFEMIKSYIGKNRGERDPNTSGTQCLIHAGIGLEHTRRGSTGFGMRPCRAAWLPLLEEGAKTRGELDQGIRTVAVDIVCVLVFSLAGREAREGKETTDG
jgi:hypothetical protein